MVDAHTSLLHEHRPDGVHYRNMQAMPTGLQPDLRERLDQWRDSRRWMYVLQHWENIQVADCTIDAEYCILRSEATVPIPTDVDAASYAPHLCAGVTVFNSMRQMKVTSGEIVAIQGLGGLGHLALQYANKMGFKVVALSSSSSKEKFAKDLGAHVYVDGSKENHAEALMKLGGAAMIVSTAPNPEIMGDLVNGLAPGGKLIILSRKLRLAFFPG